MKPKEKAVILVDRYLDEVFNETDVNFPLELPKRLALISVYEVLNELDDIKNFEGNKLSLRMIKYWQEVKQEIEKL